LIENIDGDWRGSSKPVAPGHLIYFAAANLFDPNAKVILTTENKDIIVRNITEGAETEPNSNIVSLGTLAVKGVQGGTFEHIVSKHPAGLIQSVYSVQHVTFEDMQWSSNQKVCDELDSAACGTPVIYMLDTSNGQPPNEDITLRNISLKSTVEPIAVVLDGLRITVDKLTIETSPFFSKKQANAASAALVVRNSDTINVRNYTYIPRLNSVDPKGTYNMPMSCFGSCSNVQSDFLIKWPKGIPVPTDPHHRLIAPSVQDKRPEANNSLRAHIEVQ